MGLDCGGNGVVPTDHPGRRASAQTSIEFSVLPLMVPVQSRDREHTHIPSNPPHLYPHPRKAKAKLESPASGDMGQEGPRCGANIEGRDRQVVPGSQGSLSTMAQCFNSDCPVFSPAGS